MITALNGKKLPAITVFSKALQYMRKIVLEDLDKQIKIPNRIILWILTVPAIWSHAARQVMRIAANQVILLALGTCGHVASYVINVEVFY